MVTTYFSSALATSSYRSVLTQLLVNSLLSADSQVRQTAAALAFNWSTIIAKERLRKEEEGGDLLQGTPEQEDSDWEIEVVSAVMDVLSKEKDEEVGKYGDYDVMTCSGTLKISPKQCFCSSSIACSYFQIPIPRPGGSFTASGFIASFRYQGHPGIQATGEDYCFTQSSNFGSRLGKSC